MIIHYVPFATSVSNLIIFNTLGPRVAEGVCSWAAQELPWTDAN